MAYKCHKPTLFQYFWWIGWCSSKLLPLQYNNRYTKGIAKIFEIKYITTFNLKGKQIDLCPLEKQFENENVLKVTGHSKIKFFLRVSPISTFFGWYFCQHLRVFFMNGSTFSHFLKPHIRFMTCTQIDNILIITCFLWLTEKCKSKGIAYATKMSDVVKQC